MHPASYVLAAATAVLAVTACSTQPPIDGARPSISASTRTKTFGSEACSTHATTTCIDCCYQRAAEAQAAARALGKCNKGCGKNDDACFDGCAATFTGSCQSTSAACDAYTACSDSCFLGFDPAGAM